LLIGCRTYKLKSTRDNKTFAEYIAAAWWI